MALSLGRRTRGLGADGIIILIRYILGLWGYSGIMEKKMEATMIFQRWDKQLLLQSNRGHEVVSHRGNPEPLNCESSAV